MLVPARSRADSALTRPRVARPADRGLLDRYLAEVRRFPRLDAAEERVLAQRYHDLGDEDAGRRLVQSNLYLVLRVAFRYQSQMHELLDLIQEGNLGLMRALDKFDPYREVPFSAYARYWIRAMVLRFVMESRHVRLGSTRASRKLFFNAGKVQRQLEAAGETPTTLAVAEALGVSEEEVRSVGLHLARPLSLSEPRADGQVWGDLVADTDSPSPEDAVARRDLGKVLRACMDTFADTLDDERELRIWHERLASDDPVSLADLGREFGVTRERMRQIEARMRRRLEQLFVDELGPDIQYDFLDVAEG